MQPNSDHKRGLQVPSSRGNITPHDSRQAAAALMRNQIDQIYDEPQPNEQIAAAEPVAQVTPATNPYQQTHSNHADIAAEENDPSIQARWQHYHSAWQQYYQMYYERYYQAAVQHHVSANDSKQQSTDEQQNDEPEGITKEQAASELRNELLQKVGEQTKKIRKSRHFLPIVFAVSVMLVLVVLQYNQIILANLMAYSTPASLDTSNSYISPSTDVTVGPEPLVIVPKLAIQAPVVYGLTTLEESVVETKLESGVVHYPVPGADAVPGQIGNSVFLGHSANDVFAAGDYKFVFLRLEQLQKGDQFYLNYEGKRYTYLVQETKVITPDQVSTLVLNNGKPMATLVTCVPVGTSKNRLLVIGEQVAPDPAKATAQTPTTTQSDQSEIGGGTKNFFERLFSN